MNNFEFERAMVDVLATIIESRGLKHKPVAEKAWPYKKAAFRTWQDMRNSDSPQKLTVRDAYSMASELGISMSSLCGLIEGRMLAVDIAHNKELISPQDQKIKTLDIPGSFRDVGNAGTELNAG